MDDLQTVKTMFDQDPGPDLTAIDLALRALDHEKNEEAARRHGLTSRKRVRLPRAWLIRVLAIVLLSAGGGTFWALSSTTSHSKGTAATVPHISTTKRSSPLRAPAFSSPTTGPQTGATTTTTTQPSPGRVGLSLQTVSAKELAYAGVALSAPPSGTSPTISISQAATTASAGYPYSVHDVELVVFSDANKVPPVSDELAYAVEKTVPPGSSTQAGPFGGASESQPSNNYLVVFVDATSGTVVAVVGGGP